MICMMYLEGILKIKAEKRAIGRVYLPESLDREARQYAETAGVTLSFLVRTALAEFLASDRDWQKIRKEKMNIGSGRG